MRRMLLALAAACAAILALAPLGARAQESQPAAQPLTLFTRYPAQELAVGDSVSFPLVLRADAARVAEISLRDVPAGWTATLRGGGRIVQSAYVLPGEDTELDLRVEPPADVAAGTYGLSVVARADGATAALPLTLVVQAKLPPSLELSSDLPTIRGAPDSALRFSADLRNAGDTDLNVNLIADAPAGFAVTFSTAGQEVTSLPVEAGSTKNLSIEVAAPEGAADGAFPIYVRAEGGEVQAELGLTAELVGQSTVELSTPDGRLSGEATIGATTPIQLVVRNSGTAPARAITLSGTPPSGWTVEFQPAQIDEIAPGAQVEVQANLRPAEQAVAGDYVLSFSARPEEGRSDSAEYRVTVTTSTLWGVVGIGLIAAAVAVVALAVGRFGRR